MKRSVYSEILLFISALSLFAVTAATYVIAIRSFPIFSFSFSGGDKVPTSLLRTLGLCAPAFCICTCLLSRLYRGFSLHTYLFLIAIGFIPAGGSYLFSVLSDVSARYVFSSLVFLLFPYTLCFCLLDLIGCERFSRLKRLGGAVSASLTLIIGIVLSCIAASKNILLLQILILVLCPVLPALSSVLFFFLSLCHSRMRILRASVLILGAILPVSALIRPFSFELSVGICRFLLPITTLCILFTILHPYASACITRIRRKRSSL